MVFSFVTAAAAAASGGRESEEEAALEAEAWLRVEEKLESFEEDESESVLRTSVEVVGGHDVYRSVRASWTGPRRSRPRSRDSSMNEAEAKRDKVRIALQWAGRAAVARQLTASTALRKSLFGQIAPSPSYVARCAPQALCDVLPLFLAAVSDMPYWLEGLRSALLAEVDARAASNWCVAQCLHFLRQAKWCEESVFEALDAIEAEREARQLHSSSTTTTTTEESTRPAYSRDKPQFLDESRWESIAKTLLASPAGFKLQLPKRTALYDPFRPDCAVGFVRVERVFASNTRPLLLSLHGKNGKRPPSRLIYKAGDDLRQDLGVIQGFAAMNFVFSKRATTTPGDDAPIFIGTYGVCAFSTRVGCIELVRGVRALTDVRASDTFTERQMTRLVASAAGAYVGAHVLGVRDRHSDNILLASDGTLFHIDFGHILDDKVALDTASFATTPSLRATMGPARWAQFVDACAIAFLALRADADLVVETAKNVMRAVAPRDRIEACVRRGLMLDAPDAAVAEKKLRALVNAGPDAVLTRIKNQVHALAVKRLVSKTSAPRRPSPALATGTLSKRGEGAGSGWRRRFFALLPPPPDDERDATSTSSKKPTGHLLYYFATRKAWSAMRDTGQPTHKGVIEMDAVRAVQRVHVTYDKKRSILEDPQDWQDSASCSTPQTKDEAAASKLQTVTYRFSSPLLSLRQVPSPIRPSLGNISVPPNSPKQTTPPADSYRLALVTSTRVWHLRADNEKDFYRWAALLLPYHQEDDASVVRDVAPDDDDDDDDASCNIPATPDDEGLSSELQVSKMGSFDADDEDGEEDDDNEEEQTRQQ
ncbi:hypothetical protein CTAYLR_006946 [Chrysophaeum taylorii]|uniref:PI3K/PI4K catalytic domain-containing protein n=1 Tax=Chrysophaeum taylorii TaxID=2483200 RepID=A0AAD7XLT6_9STRA|nr:hypothetical protein CTAYLR_006946 [Chrysophaeum taylorii]